MSRRIFAGQSVAAWLLLSGSLLAQAPRVEQPAVTINVARKDAAVEGNTAPGAVVSAVALSPDGRTLAVAGDDNVARLFALDGQNERELRGHLRWVRGAAFSLDGQTVATSGADRKLIIWDVRSGRKLQELSAQVQAYCLAASPSDARLALAGFGDRVQVFTSAGAAAGELPCSCSDMRTIAFSPDGSQLAGGGRDGRVMLWTLPRGGLTVTDGSSSSGQERLLGRHRRAVHAAAYSHDGQWLATAGDGDVIRIWDVRTGKERLWIPKAGKTRALAFCGPNYVAAGGTDNRIGIWDLNRVEALWQQKKLRETVPLEPDVQLIGHQGSVTSIVYDARTSTMISGSYDTTIRVWNLKLGPTVGGPGQRTTEVGDGTTKQR
jgi:WD40 repeat protein